MGKDGPAKLAQAREAWRRPGQALYRSDSAPSARCRGKPRALPQKRRGWRGSSSNSSSRSRLEEVEEEERGCRAWLQETQGVQQCAKPLQACAHAPMRPCARAPVPVPSMLALWTHVCSRHGASRPAGLPCTLGFGRRTGTSGATHARWHPWHARLAAGCEEMRLGVCEMMVLYACPQKKQSRGRCPRTPCLFYSSLRSPGAPRPTYRHLGVCIATRRYKLIRASLTWARRM